MVGISAPNIIQLNERIVGLVVPLCLNKEDVLGGTRDSHTETSRTEIIALDSPRKDSGCVGCCNVIAKEQGLNVNGNTTLPRNACVAGDCRERVLKTGVG